MEFQDRTSELKRLDLLADSATGGLAVVYGRRRIGKTRLLLEWVKRKAGLYTVADQSSADIQRRYLADAVGSVLPGFADVEYPDWSSLLTRLAADAKAANWRGPIVFDELPYLVQQDAAMPSLLQRWIDHDAKQAGLVVAIAGSSQRMMQGLVLSPSAPLYGRASVILEIGPIPPEFLRKALRLERSRELIEAYSCWGGVPRYWELALEQRGDARSQVDRIALDPLGPLHLEPDRILLEELPPALEVRPVLDAIGSGAHRVSEIAGRVGKPATSMSRPLERLLRMDLIRREVPFGESEKKSRASLYSISDPFFRLWFRIIAPHRAQLASGSSNARLAILDRYWDNLVAEAWEDLCRMQLPNLGRRTSLGRLGPWGPAARWWRGNAPEWDVVSASETGACVVIGEVKWSSRPFTKAAIAREVDSLLSRTPPPLPPSLRNAEVIHALFIPSRADVTQGSNLNGVRIVSAQDLL